MVDASGIHPDPEKINALRDMEHPTNVTELRRLIIPWNDESTRSPLACTTSQSIIISLKTIFSRFGIPEIFTSDNGPNYASKDFANFAKDYGFTHVTSSPLYAQANGEAERAVQTVKRLFDKCTDLRLALLAYRSTPLEQGYSPA